MRLKKGEREQVRLKYGGHCAYCGVLLGGRWHADHLAPVVRELLSKKTAAGTWRQVSGKPLRPEHDVLENMIPACAPCNISKRRQTLEGWRTWIAGHINSLNSYHPIYRLAKSYGLIVETGVPVMFHFERLVVMDNGQAMTTSMLRGRFDAARLKAGIEKSAFQMRDLRAKAATDKEESTGSIRDARDQLGHTAVGMTEQYIRRRKGLKVLPTK